MMSTGFRELCAYRMDICLPQVARPATIRGEAVHNISELRNENLPSTHFCLVLMTLFWYGVLVDRVRAEQGRGGHRQHTMGRLPGSLDSSLPDSRHHDAHGTT
jgi:hypothetical protein